MIHFIYRWKDLHNPDAILCTKYVGMTNNPNVRFAYHMRCDGTNPQKDAWVQELANQRTKPVVEIIEIVYDGRAAAFEREEYWINYYLDQGCDLFNIKRAIRKSSTTRRSETDPVDCDLDHLTSFHDDFTSMWNATLMANKNPIGEKRLYILEWHNITVGLWVSSTHDKKLGEDFDDWCASQWEIEDRIVYGDNAPFSGRY